MATAPDIQLSREEDRVLRAWTPVILRSALFSAAVLLLIGLIESIVASPGHYSARFHQLQRGINLRSPEDFLPLLGDALAGGGRATATIGLMVLTLVPIGRVAFSLFFFLRQKDYPYVAITAYVLAALILGAALGRIG
jgi:uncharacterized membrane protein